MRFHSTTESADPPPLSIVGLYALGMGAESRHEPGKLERAARLSPANGGVD